MLQLLPGILRINDLVLAIYTAENMEIYSYKTDDFIIRLNPQFDEIYLSLYQAIPCGLIINELVSNALKHAFKKNKEGKLIHNKDRRLEPNLDNFPMPRRDLLDDKKYIYMYI